MDKIKKVSGHNYDRQTMREFTYSKSVELTQRGIALQKIYVLLLISVNKPKLSVTKHGQTLIWAHVYNTSRYTANTKMYSGILHTHTHTHTHRWGMGGFLIICSFTWHQPCNKQPNSAVSTSFRWIFKTRYKKLVTHSESHATWA